MYTYVYVFCSPQMSDCVSQGDAVTDDAGGSKNGFKGLKSGKYNLSGTKKKLLSFINGKVKRSKAF